MVSDLSNTLLSSVIVHFHPAATFARAASFLALGGLARSRFISRHKREQASGFL
jgi:hypothetical protein